MSINTQIPHSSASGDQAAPSRVQYRWACAVFSLLCGVILDCIVCNRLSFRFEIPAYTGLLLFAPCVLAAYLAAVAGVKALSVKGKGKSGGNRWVYLIPVVCSLAMLLVAWGIAGKVEVSCDFENRQAVQFAQRSFSTMHPIVHTLVCGYILESFGTTEAIAVLQVACYTLSIWVFCAFLRRIGASVPFATILSMGMTWLAMPEILYIIKDALFVPSFIILMVSLCAYPLGWRKWDAVCFAIGLTGVGIWRHDGLATVVLVSAALVLLCAWRKQGWGTVLPPLGAALVSIAFCVVALPKWVNASSEATGTGWAMPATIICEIVVEGGDISPEEKAVIEELVMPYDMIKEHHDMLSDAHGEKYIWPGFFASDEEAYRHSFCWSLSWKGKELLPLFLRLAWKNPGITCGFIFRNADLVWNPARTLRSPVFYVVPILFLCAILLFLPTPVEGKLPILPLLANLAVVVLVATTYEFRYVTPTVCSLPLMLAYVRHMLQQKKIKN